ncbi:polysaccharide biosynthesis/export family protein [Ensifer sp. MJa1]|uniref:polysaccharide biosynthesis/export family protein n=1 Tax=Ensifer sp. MJa1 TaxID=2919888 RepID=UPI00300A7E01
MKPLVDKTYASAPLAGKDRGSRQSVRGYLLLQILAVVVALLAANFARAEDYVLDSGDVVRILVFGEAAYPLEVVVDDRGTIALPLLGDVRARGLTPSALSEDIRRAYQQRKLILAPYVKVEIGQYRPFFISGAVAHPGSYPFQPGITVRHALALAGGFRPTTAGATVPALQIADLRSERANLMIEEYRLKVRLARLHAESKLVDRIVVPIDPPAELGQGLIDDIISTEQAQLTARLTAFRDDISYLQASLARLKKEAELLAGAKGERQQTVKSQLDELEAVRTLRQKGLITNSNVMALERAHNNYRLDLAQFEMQQTRLQQDLLTMEGELRKKHQEHEFQSISDTQETQVQLAKLGSQLRYLSDKLLFVFEYGEHRTLEDLQGSVRIVIFRRGQKIGQEVAADENTAVNAGDVIEVSVVASKDFYSSAAASRPNPVANVDKKAF